MNEEFATKLAKLAFETWSQAEMERLHVKTDPTMVWNVLAPDARASWVAAARAVAGTVGSTIIIAIANGVGADELAKLEERVVALESQNYD